MCGRYAASRSPDDLVEEFRVERVTADGVLEPDYNVAPTKPVYAVLERPPRDDPTGRPQRELRVVTWGLVPSWASDRRIASRLVNARVETVAERPAFRWAFARRRCLLPADGYYEWYAEGGAASDSPRGGKRKQPYFIAPRDGGLLAMAGIYEIWRDPAVDRDDPGAWLWSAAVLTTRAEDSLGRLHDRMPLLVEPARYAAWLDPAVGDPATVRGLLVPATPGRLVAVPVSTAVNSVDNNGPRLLTPVHPAAPDLARHDQPTLF